MNNKKLLFERMNLIGNMPVNENINEEVPSGNLISDLQKIYFKYGYFPINEPDGSIRFIENDDEFSNYINNISQSWNKISLPF